MMSGLIWKIVLTIMIQGQPVEFITTGKYSTQTECSKELDKLTRMKTDETWFLSCVYEIHA